MNILRLDGIREAIHGVGNDYDLRIPHLFRHVGLVGVILFGVAVFQLVNNVPQQARLIATVGILLILPATITLIVTRSLKGLRLRIRDRIISLVDWKGDETILDVGVGSGITLFGCARRLTTGKAIGIDIYDPNSGGGTADIFWKNAKREGVTERVELYNMDARDMTFEDETFNIVVSTFAFHHIGNSARDRQKASREIVRVLKPGGKVMIYDAEFALKELQDLMHEAGLINVHVDKGRFLLVVGEKPI